jgi:Ras-related protein Rab-7A
LDKALPKDPSTFPFFVFGNKKDKENERQVSQQQAKEWIKKQVTPVPWEETSALDSLCIEKAFDKIANTMLRNSLKSSSK